MSLLDKIVKHPEHEKQTLLKTGSLLLNKAFSSNTYATGCGEM